MATQYFLLLVALLCLLPCSSSSTLGQGESASSQDEDNTAASNDLLHLSYDFGQDHLLEDVGDVDGSAGNCTFLRNGWNATVCSINGAPCKANSYYDELIYHDININVTSGAMTWLIVQPLTRLEVKYIALLDPKSEMLSSSPENITLLIAETKCFGDWPYDSNCTCELVDTWYMKPNPLYITLKWPDSGRCDWFEMTIEVPPLYEHDACDTYFPKELLAPPYEGSGAIQFLYDPSAEFDQGSAWYSIFSYTASNSKSFFRSQWFVVIVCVATTLAVGAIGLLVGYLVLRHHREPGQNYTTL
eukprot:TRINITY_DN6767_c0_g1_i1.p1 TRINITY_DN6767_c0_g1~~TRINITY_DN6767_c0_g1_i1.p1  ORF type:complete len:302 (-),score=33.33 TRINITY_DN6767_c0_g1_i1:36-941(-)